MQAATLLQLESWIECTKSDRIKNSRTGEHINSQSSHLGCSNWPVWGSVCCQQDFLTCPRAVFLLFFKHLPYFWEMFQGFGHDKCRLQLQKIKQQSSKSSRYRERGEILLYPVLKIKFFTFNRLSGVFLKRHRTRLLSH